MGYHMATRISRFHIVPENEAAALAAIKAMAGKGSYGHGSWSWVGTDDFLQATTLAQALRAWRWAVGRTGPGTVEVATLLFQGENYGDEDALFAALAPFVEAGSFIEMQGEDGDLWRWVFDGKAAHKQSPIITWPEVVPC